MADNVITFSNEKGKATDNSANFTTKMCDNPECNKFKTATHTSSKCWRQHPELCPDDKKSKFNVRKNNYLRGQRKFGKSEENSQERKDDKRAPRTFIKKARKFLNKDMKQIILANRTILWIKIQCLILRTLIMPRQINSKLKQARRLRSYWLEWMTIIIPERSVTQNLVNPINLQMRMEKTVHQKNQSKNAPNAGNGDTTLQRSAKLKVMMISPPSLRRQTWLPVGKVKLLLGESKQLIFWIISSIVHSGSTHPLTHSIFKYSINTMLLIKLNIKLNKIVKIKIKI